MRTKQALKNLISSLLLELVLAISGIIIPRFFTVVYGSSVNGLVSSIGQFITYMSLVEAGIGAAGTISLYGPLANKDNNSISAILSAARQFYKRSGMIFVVLVAVLIGFYPYIVENEIANIGFVRMMIFILSINGIVDYFILGKYRILLQADQKGYVVYNAQILGTVLMSVISIILIELRLSALLVKGVAAIIYVLRCLIIVIYVKKHYPDINIKANPDKSSFSQCWSALLHQIVGMIVNNTDLVLLTVLLKENALVYVSIYSVYNLVAYSLKTLLSSISNGIHASFGQIIANGETEVLKKSFSTYEYLYFILVFFCYVCMGVLLYPFIGLYCADFVDGAKYLSWAYVIMFTAVSFIQTLRIPSMTIYIAAGHFKQTQGRAIIEAVINLVVSIILIKPLGIVGVLLGTFLSYFYRTIDVILYSAKHFLPGTLPKTISRILRNGIAAILAIFFGIKTIPITVESWIYWFLYSAIFAAISVIIFGGVNLLFEKQEFFVCINRLKDILKKGRRTC